LLDLDVAVLHEEVDLVVCETLILPRHAVVGDWDLGDEYEECLFLTSFILDDETRMYV
jgi:hypothetical protein